MFSVIFNEDEPVPNNLSIHHVHFPEVKNFVRNIDLKW